MGLLQAKEKEYTFCKRNENNTVYCEKGTGDPDGDHKKSAHIEMEQRPELGGELRTLNVFGNEKDTEYLKRYAQSNVSVQVAVKKSRGET